MSKKEYRQSGSVYLEYSRIQSDINETKALLNA